MTDPIKARFELKLMCIKDAVDDLLKDGTENHLLRLERLIKEAREYYGNPWSAYTGKRCETCDALDCEHCLRTESRGETKCL